MWRGALRPHMRESKAWMRRTGCCAPRDVRDPSQSCVSRKASMEVFPHLDDAIRVFVMPNRCAMKEAVDVRADKCCRCCERHWKCRPKGAQLPVLRTREPPDNILKSSDLVLLLLDYPSGCTGRDTKVSAPADANVSLSPHKLRVIHSCRGHHRPGC